MTRRRLHILTLVVLLSPLASALMATPVNRIALRHAPDPHENQVWISALRQSQFSIVPHVAAHTSCQVSEPPEALATPDPLVEGPGHGTGVTVSFIVGIDGGVHSPFILQGANPAEDGAVLKAVRSWRYRPARCNGVPIDAEARVQFRSR